MYSIESLIFVQCCSLGYQVLAVLIGQGEYLKQNSLHSHSDLISQTLSKVFLFLTKPSLNRIKDTLESYSQWCDDDPLTTGSLPKKNVYV